MEATFFTICFQERKKNLRKRIESWWLFDKNKNKKKEREREEKAKVFIILMGTFSSFLSDKWDGKLQGKWKEIKNREKNFQTEKKTAFKCVLQVIWTFYKNAFIFFD